MPICWTSRRFFTRFLHTWRRRRRQNGRVASATSPPTVTDARLTLRLFFFFWHGRRIPRTCRYHTNTILNRGTSKKILWKIRLIKKKRKKRTYLFFTFCGRKLLLLLSAVNFRSSVITGGKKKTLHLKLIMRIIYPESDENGTRNARTTTITYNVRSENRPAVIFERKIKN